MVLHGKDKGVLDLCVLDCITDGVSLTSKTIKGLHSYLFTYLRSETRFTQYTYTDQCFRDVPFVR